MTETKNGTEIPQTPGEKIFLLVDHQGLSNNLLQIFRFFICRVGWGGLIPWPFQLKNSKTVSLMGIFLSLTVFEVRRQGEEGREETGNDFVSPDSCLLCLLGFLKLAPNRST